MLRQAERQEEGVGRGKAAIRPHRRRPLNDVERLPRLQTKYVVLIWFSTIKSQQVLVSNAMLLAFYYVFD